MTNCNLSSNAELIEMTQEGNTTISEFMENKDEIILNVKIDIKK